MEKGNEAVDKVVPGDELGEKDRYISGDGTFVRNNTIYSSMLGYLKKEAKNGEKTIISVVSQKSPIVPDVGDTVMARVVYVTERSVHVRILSVNDKPVSSSFKGSIRKEHVRAFEVDKVVLSDSFRIGDIVKASVISRGDRRSYYLSTANNDLGVVIATSAANAIMIPVSWELMQCTKTGVFEKRKVAKLLDDEEMKTMRIKQEIKDLVG